MVSFFLRVLVKAELTTRRLKKKVSRVVDGSHPARHHCCSPHSSSKYPPLLQASIHITDAFLAQQIGPSALVGIALFVFLTPVQTRVMRMQFQVRKSSMKASLSTTLSPLL